ncbi:VWA domain-containing protein [Rickettsiales bacterium]|nr:VWA domain-containing protein [Rickettsiales bacterium]
MITKDFHFTDPIWLWGFLIVPVIWFLFSFYKDYGNVSEKIRNFIDPQLLEHIIADSPKHKAKLWLKHISLSLIITLFLLAMAGPRWDYQETELFQSDASMVILLDLSRSMEANDVSPSRMIRARQEIEDLANLSQGNKIGLIAFARVPHIVSPITDDMETIKHLLPSLNPDLISQQGSNIVPAVEIASRMLNAEPGENKMIVVMSDGEFEDAASMFDIKDYLGKNISLHTLGLGTIEGAPVPDGKGNLFKEGGKIVISKLDQIKLNELAKIGNGTNMIASYLDDDSKTLLSVLKKDENALEQKRKVRQWEERFYIPLAIAMLLLLPFFRRSAQFLIIVILFSMPQKSYAFSWKDLFFNDNQIAKQDYQQKNYDEAAKKFDDKYNKAVSQYRAGDFAGAEENFSKLKDAQYNLGNTLAQQGKLDEAIKQYEKVLKENPDHKRAKKNLQIVKEMQKQQQKQQNKDNQKKDDEQNKQDQKQQQQQKQDQNQDNNNQDNKQNQDQDQDQKQKPDSGKEQGNEKNKKDQGDKENKPEPDDKENDDKKDQSKKDEEEDKNKDGEKEDKNKKPSRSESQGQKNDDKSNQPRTEQDIKADQWLNRIEGDSKDILQKQFYIKENSTPTKGGSRPW